MTDPVLYDERDDIAIITINRPEKKNTLTDAVIQRIADGIDAATKSAEVVAVVLRGAGDTLTAGYDLTAGAASDDVVGTTGGDEPGWSTPSRPYPVEIGDRLRSRRCTRFPPCDRPPLRRGSPRVRPQAVVKLSCRFESSKPAGTEPVVAYR
jgi:hypothetical protein